jgi:hypothetical protein
MAASAKTDGTISHDLAVIGVRLLDDAYMAWLAAEVESEQALRAWLTGAVSHSAAYVAYRAAVDREEAAARDLHRLCELTQPCQDQLGRSE